MKGSSRTQSSRGTASNGDHGAHAVPTEEPEMWWKMVDRTRDGLPREKDDPACFDRERFAHNHHLTRQFFRLGGFRAFPDVVMVDVTFTELLGLDEVNGTFTVEADLWLIWHDESFCEREWDNQVRKQVEAFTIPFVTVNDVVDGIDVPDVDTPENVRHRGIVWLRMHGKHDAPGTLYKKVTMQLTIRDDNPLFEFPFDFQDLTIKFEMPGSEKPHSVDNGRVLLPLNVEIKAEHDMLEWHCKHLLNCRASIPRNTS